MALVLSWAYELTPDGVKPTKSVPLSESITKVTGRRLDFVIIELLVIALGFLGRSNLTNLKKICLVWVASGRSSLTPTLASEGQLSTKSGHTSIVYNLSKRQSSLAGSVVPVTYS